MREWIQKIYSLSYYFFCLYLSCLDFDLFPEALLLRYLIDLVYSYYISKVPNHIYVLKGYISIYFGFIECLYMHLFSQIFGGNSRVTKNWVSNSSYAWLSFVNKIHAVLLFSIFHMKFNFWSIVRFVML